jgi:hypothetical protein
MVARTNLRPPGGTKLGPLRFDVRKYTIRTALASVQTRYMCVLYAVQEHRTHTQHSMLPVRRFGYDAETQHTTHHSKITHKYLMGSAMTVHLKACPPHTPR